MYVFSVLFRLLFFFLSRFLRLKCFRLTNACTEWYWSQNRNEWFVICSQQIEPKRFVQFWEEQTICHTYIFPYFAVLLCNSGHEKLTITHIYYINHLADHCTFVIAIFPTWLSVSMLISHFNEHSHINLMTNDEHADRHIAIKIGNVFEFNGKCNDHIMGKGSKMNLGYFPYRGKIENKNKMRMKWEK